MIRIAGIEFAYAETGTPFVLRVGALSIDAGSHVAIVGPSGCGKTTLLHLIAGILRPRAGRITVGDTDVTALPDADRRDFRIANVGFVFQDFELIEYLTVEQNILLPCLINPAAPLDDDTRARAAELATSLGIGDKLRRNVGRLSQGERQRVAICRAMLMRPSLILADEPTGNLDPASKRQTIDLLRQTASDAGATLIVVTHDHNVLDGFDRVIDMTDGTRDAAVSEQEPGDSDAPVAVAAPSEIRNPKSAILPRLASLALREARYQWVRTAILVACVAVVVFLPLAVRVITSRAQAELRRRAEATPIVLGAPASRFDLTLHALYFRTPVRSAVTFGDAARVRDTGWAEAYPLNVTHTARGYPVVGTTLEYLDFRGLRVARGHGLTRLGDCVLGADVADALGVGPDDHLMSDADNVFDIAGAYPLNMRVTGVLRRTHTPDDGAVFVDIHTAWVITGIGHGHVDAKTADPIAIAKPATDADGNIVMQPGVVEFQQITDENIASFHFHGDPATFPVTAIVSVPHDEKSATLLSARFSDGAVVALRPAEVIAEMGQMVFKVRRVFDGVVALVVGATLLLVALVVALTLRLRRREMDTMFKLGCARGATATLQALGLGVVLVGGVAIAAAGLLIALPFAGALMRMVLLS
ncbi:MAG: ATP-binding cassette domain-containing protein [Phycisphaera sp.]|nr:ATP-binding cassette domain-containing protein [Phycisphaera sp.]